MNTNNKKIAKYVYKINKSVKNPNNKLSIYLKHLNFYSMKGGDDVSNRITELNTILDELKTRPPLNIERAVYDRINQTDRDINEFLEVLKNTSHSILTDIGYTNVEANRILGIV